MRKFFVDKFIADNIKYCYLDMKYEKFYPQIG